MATYVYRCTNKECTNNNVEVDVVKPMSESSSKEVCKECSKEMTKVFIPFSARTLDGFKR